MTQRKTKETLLLLLPLYLFGCLTLQAMTDAKAVQIATSLSKENAQHKEARMMWWREARFGMFIHWGLYAQAARHEWVTHNGKRVPWETCQTFTGSWGYHRDVEQKVAVLADDVRQGADKIIDGPELGFFDIAPSTDGNLVIGLPLG